MYEEFQTEPPAGRLSAPQAVACVFWRVLERLGSWVERFWHKPCLSVEHWRPDHQSPPTMLSVRSLKRIAQKAGLSPAPAPPFVKIDAGVEDGNEASSPSLGAKVARKAGKHARIVTPNEKDAAEAREPSEPCCTCRGDTCPCHDAARLRLWTSPRRSQQTRSHHRRSAS